MNAILEDLVYGTIFIFEGKIFKKGNTGWTVLGANLSERQYYGPKDPYASIMSAEPFLGGEFQPKYPVWFNTKTSVTVE